MAEYKNIKSLGLGIIAFDATEHLYNIISEIRDLVDYVVVAVQKVSYHGRPMDPTDLYEIRRLKDEGLVDKILYCKLDTSKFPRVQETIKRNLLVRDITNHGCSHELIIDSDEYYTHDSFAKALQTIDDNDYEMTYCRYVNYYHDYMHYLLYPFKEGNYVPFVAKVKYHFGWQCTDFPKPSDPTRRFVRPKEVKTNIVTGQQYNEYLVDYYEFPWDDLRMHHLSWLRADIRKKMNDWSSATYFGDRLAIIDKAVERFKHFSDDNMQEQATILFNTPGNKVTIGKFKRQYIFPKADYHERVTNQPRRKNLLILVHLTEEQIPLRECILDTWASSLDENTRVLFYSNDAPNDVFSYDEEIRHARFPKMVKEGFELTDAVMRYVHGYTDKEGKLVRNYEFRPEYIMKVEADQYVWVSKVQQFLDTETDDSLFYMGGVKASERTKFALCPTDGWVLMSWNCMEKILSVVGKSDSKERRPYDLEEMFRLLSEYYYDDKMPSLHNYIRIIRTDVDDLGDREDIDNPSLHGIVKICSVSDEIGRKMDKNTLLTTYKMRHVHELALKGTYGDGYEYQPSCISLKPDTQIYWLEGQEASHVEDKPRLLHKDEFLCDFSSKMDELFRLKYNRKM